jgi:hypothetical protein
MALTAWCEWVTVSVCWRSVTVRQASGSDGQDLPGHSTSALLGPQDCNVLNKLPNSVQTKVKAELHEIWMAETREAAHQAFNRTVKRFGAKYPQAMDCLAKYRDELLAFYGFPEQANVNGDELS